jgi:hypothetical protein
MIKTKLTAAQQMKMLMESVGWGAAPQQIDEELVFESDEAEIAHYIALADELRAQQQGGMGAPGGMPSGEMPMGERRAPQIEESEDEIVFESDEAEIAHYMKLADELRAQQQGGMAGGVAPAPRGMMGGRSQYANMEAMPMMEKYQRYLKARMK